VYPTSSISDAQWAVLEPLLPAPGNTGGRGGRPEKHPRRLVLDPIFHLVRGGIAWAALPHGFPPHQTVYGIFGRWARDDAWRNIHDALRDLVRVHEGRDPLPTAAIIDSQSVRGADTVAGLTRGYDAGKKINGRKRHIAVDTGGLLLAVVVTIAGIQDRDAAHRLLTVLRGRFSTIGLVWADGGYTGRLVILGAQDPGPHRGSGQTHRRRQGLQGPAAPLGRGAHLRLDQQVPTLRAGL